MSIARFSIEKPIYTWLLIIFCLFGGAAGYLSVGKLEDPVFTLKSALVITPYPGATAAEVAVEVSEVLESSIQKMDEVDTITSSNRPGISVIEIEIKDTYDGTELPQVWDDLRDRVADAVPNLPQGAFTPRVNDSFGDVYGLYYAITADGYTDAEIWDIATFLRREVLSVEGVADAELLGLPEEAIFIEPASATLTNLGLPPQVLFEAVAAANSLATGGLVDNGSRRLQVEAPPADSAVDEIGALNFGFAGEIVNLRDVASIRRERIEDPSHIIRHNGSEAFTLAIAGLISENIVTVGARVEERLAEVAPLLPVGVDLEPIYEQHRVVEDANGEFLVSLAMSVGVVIAVLAVFMGWRAAIVVGGSLLLTVTFTFLFMALFDIKVERISLGALIIAMGMLVDNAIVVAEGMQIQMRRGHSAPEAAEDVARFTQVPLLGATIIGIMAFSGIGLSPNASGEFLFSLFAVISISLMLSWLLAVTVTPLLASYLFKRGAADGADGDPYDTRFFRAYGGVVRAALRFRWFVIVGLVGGTAACVVAFGSVTQQFFPPANTPLFYLNYKAAQGTSIIETEQDLAIIEDWLLSRDDVVSVTMTAGRSLSRFLLTYTPADPDPSYGQIVIRAESFDAIPAIRDDLAAFASDALPWAETRVQQIIYGPPVGADVEVRLSGPDPDVLRRLADEAQRIFERETEFLIVERIDWRERELVTQPVFASDRGRALGLTRSDVARAVALVGDGQRAGTFRERDRLIPIVLRTPRAEFENGEMILDQSLYSPVTEDYTTVSQVVDGFEVLARDTLIEKRNRVPTISVQAFTPPDILPPQPFGEVRDAVEAMSLPDGYRMEWGGEFETAGDAQASLGRQMPLAFGTMFLITILLFGKVRQTMVVWTVVPMAVNGVALGLLFTGLPFSFTALLGLLSLSGMLIKNAIVLVEEIDAQKDSGRSQHESIVIASISRLRPVLLAAATTILGMAPLLWDVFFASMAVTIMAGLGFASILTLVGVPALYETYVRANKRVKRVEAPQTSSTSSEPSQATSPYRAAAE